MEWVCVVVVVVVKFMLNVREQRKEDEKGENFKIYYFCVQKRESSRKDG